MEVLYLVLYLLGAGFGICAVFLGIRKRESKMIIGICSIMAILLGSGPNLIDRYLIEHPEPAEISDLNSLAHKSDLDSLARKSDLDSLLKKSDIATINRIVSDYDKTNNQTLIARYPLGYALFYSFTTSPVIYAPKEAQHTFHFSVDWDNAKISTSPTSPTVSFPVK